MSDLETSDIRGIIQDDGPPNVPGPTFRNPALTLATTIYRDRTAGTGGYWQNMPDAAGVLGWVPMTGGGGAATLGWPPYVVSAGDPLAPYTTIEAAIVAAVGNGHTAELPAVVQVMPGDYTPAGGLITLPPGISLVAMSSGGDGGDATFTGGDVTVNGGLLIAPATAASYTVAGIQFTPPPGTAPLTLAGVADVLLSIKSCFFSATTGSTFVFTNTGPGTSVTMLHTTGLCSDPALLTPLLLNASVASFACFQTLFDRVIVPAASGVVVELGGAVPAALQLDNSQAFGRFLLGPGCSVSFFGTNARTSVAPMFTTADAGGSVFIDSASTVTSPAPFVSGPGFVTSRAFVVNDPDFDVSSTAKDAATPSYASAGATQLYVGPQPAATGATYPDSVALLPVDPGGLAPFVLNLRPLASYLQGTEIIIKSVGLGTIAVTPAVGDQIDTLGVGLPYVIPAPVAGVYQSIRLVASNLPDQGTGTRPILWLSLP